MGYFITWGSLAVIVFVFFAFLYELNKLYYANNILKETLGAPDILEALSNSKMSKLSESYKKTINIVTDYGNKTNNLSFEFFNSDTVSKVQNLNLRMLDSASGTLVGLGLLGTFLGLTVGIAGFDSTNSENIQLSIQNLLNGMSTAFSTSLLGMFAHLFTQH